jgi:uncharacterized protein DUF397
MSLLQDDDEYRLNWRKAKRSIANGSCVELASTPGIIAVRDSQDADGLVLHYPRSAWASFLGAARAGDFDVSR